jgi:hypothetical protein
MLPQRGRRSFRLHSVLLLQAQYVAEVYNWVEVWYINPVALLTWEAGESG